MSAITRASSIDRAKELEPMSACERLIITHEVSTRSPMPCGKRIALSDRKSVFDLLSQGLSLPRIAQRMGINVATARNIVARGFSRCGRCGRLIESGDLCPICSLPALAPFGERLRAFRAATGISQLGLSLKLGVDPSQVRNWETGRRQPTERQCKMLAELLGLDMQELTGIMESD
jgi:DNA-binding XRE family transcriptional regulator